MKIPRHYLAFACCIVSLYVVGWSTYGVYTGLFLSSLALATISAVIGVSCVEEEPENGSRDNQSLPLSK